MPNKFDVTTNKKSIAGQLEVFISQMNNHSVNEIKDKVRNILQDEETSISVHTKNKWMHELEKPMSKFKIMEMITNLYMKAANLGLTD